MVAVSCRGPFGVGPLLLLLSGIRSEIVPPPQYTHHNRLLYPRFPFHEPSPKYPRIPCNVSHARREKRHTNSIGTLRPNLNVVSVLLHPLRGSADPRNAGRRDVDVTYEKLHSVENSKNENSPGTYAILLPHSAFPLLEKRAGKNSAKIRVENTRRTVRYIFLRFR